MRELGDYIPAEELEFWAMLMDLRAQKNSRIGVVAWICNLNHTPTTTIWYRSLWWSKVTATTASK